MMSFIRQHFAQSCLRTAAPLRWSSRELPSNAVYGGVRTIACGKESLWNREHELCGSCRKPNLIDARYIVRCRYFATEGSSKKDSPNVVKKTREPGKGVGPITWVGMLVTLGIGTVVLAGMLYVKTKKETAQDRERKRVLGKASIGGSFELIDHNGKPCSSKDFLGHWILLYFGFTHCPDVCPDEMEKLVDAVDILDKVPDVPKVQPLFITVDPERDSVPVVKAYVKEFSPKFIGLTGSKDQVEQATRAYRVYYSAGPQDVDKDYIVDHTIITYLINPDGEFVDYFGQTKSAKQIADSIQLQMLKYNRNKSKWL